MEEKEGERKEKKEEEKCYVGRRKGIGKQNPKRVENYLKSKGLTRSHITNFKHTDMSYIAFITHIHIV